MRPQFKAPKQPKHFSALVKLASALMSDSLAAMSVAMLASCGQVSAAVLSFDSLVQKAQDKSFNLRIAAIDTGIARAEVNSARAEFFPKLNAGFSTEYVKSLTGNGAGSSQSSNQGGNGANQQVAVVGNTILPGNTRYQGVFSLNLQQTAIDFGVRAKEYVAAKRRWQSAQVGEKVEFRNLKLSLMDVYADALIAYKSLKAKEKILPLHRELYVIKRRLYDSGKLSKVQVSEQAIELATLVDEIQQHKERLSSRLEDLAAYTQEKYSVEDIQLVDFADNEPFPLTNLDSALLPDCKRYEYLIAGKKAELQSLIRQRLPQIGYYTGFVLYGSDQNSWGRALGDMGPRQVTFGINANLPIFDGFKNAAECQKKRLEIRRLETERDGRLWELRSRFEKLGASANMYGAELTTKAEILSNGKEKLGMVSRLNSQEVSDKGALLLEQAAIIEQELAIERARIQRISALRAMRIIAEG